MEKAKKSSARRHHSGSKRSATPLILVLAGGLILLVTALLALPRQPAVPYTPEVTGAPALQTDQEKIDLGDVKLGTTVNVSFQLKNVGDQPLRFSKLPYVEVREGC